MAKIEILICQQDGTILQAFDLMEGNAVGEMDDIRLADEVKDVLSHKYAIEDK